MAYANVRDVEVRMFRPLTDVESDGAQELLDDVEALILDQFPDILSGSASRLRRLVSVESAAVARVLRNPGGWRQAQEAIDDYSRSWTTDSQQSSGLLEVTDEEWARLRPDGQASASGAFTIVMSD